MIMVVQDCADYNGEELKRRVDLLNDLLVLIRRCRIKAALKTSRDNGFELRVRHTLRNWGDGGLELSRYQRCNHAHERYARVAQPSLGGAPPPPGPSALH